MTGERVLLADGAIDLRLGRWQDVLSDVERCDSIVTDPPYSARTHEGHDDGASLSNRAGVGWGRGDGGVDKLRPRRALSYASLDVDGIDEIASSLVPFCRGWFVAMSDSVLCEPWRAAFEDRGLTGFQPVPCVIRGMTVRMSGDGPSSWAVYLNVARPKALSRWGTLDGAYIAGQGERVAIGGKPLGLMRAIVRDYTRPGDLVVDPFCGGGTTALACAMEGRRCITSEMDPKTFALAKKRLERGFTVDMFAHERPQRVRAKQGGLL